MTYPEMQIRPEMVLTNIRYWKTSFSRSDLFFRLQLLFSQFILCVVLNSSISNRCTSHYTTRKINHVTAIPPSLPPAPRLPHPPRRPCHPLLCLRVAGAQ